MFVVESLIIVIMIISMDNRTEWSLIRAAIITCDKKFIFTSNDYSQNWTPLGPITNLT